MLYTSPVHQVTLIRRYKRFLADIRWPDGTVATVHCPNSGSMKGCVGEGWPAMISDSLNPNRKLRYTLEMVHNGACWIGVNTQIPNRIAEEALLANRLEALAGFHTIRREVKYGSNSRIDLLASDADGDTYIEVKNVTLVEDDGFYRFPDAVTARGLKHLQELIDMIAAGHRAAMLFVIQRCDGTTFRPATHIDPAYADGLQRAEAAGVQIVAALAEVSPLGAHLTGQTVPYSFD